MYRRTSHIREPLVHWFGYLLTLLFSTAHLGWLYSMPAVSWAETPCSSHLSPTSSGLCCGLGFTLTTSSILWIFMPKILTPHRYCQVLLPAQDVARTHRQQSQPQRVCMSEPEKGTPRLSFSKGDISVTVFWKKKFQSFPFLYPSLRSKGSCPEDTLPIALRQSVWLLFGGAKLLFTFDYLQL